MASATAVQLIRIARLRRFVAVFARGGDREATAAALLELSRASRAGGLHGESLKRARQAAQVLADEDQSELGVRSLLHLASILLDGGDPDAAAAAAEVAYDRAGALGSSAGQDLRAVAALLGGVASALRGDPDVARGQLDEARERFVAGGHPEGAALALTQHAMLDIAAEHWAGAEVCFAFARDFYVASNQHQAAAEVGALAARAFATDARSEADVWFLRAIADADRAAAHSLAAELAVEHAEYIERAGAFEAAAELAIEAARRCALVADATVARPLLLRARLQLARLSEDAAEALRHVEAAFELALDQQDPGALGSAIELVVTGLVEVRFGLAGWRLVDRFRERLASAGFSALADSATVALDELRPLVEEERARLEPAESDQSPAEPTAADEVAARARDPVE